MVRMNRGDAKLGIFTNIVKGEVYADTPDGCNHSTDLTPYQSIPSEPQQTQNAIPDAKRYGNRSGIGKKTSVV